MQFRFYTLPPSQAQFELKSQRRGSICSSARRIYINNNGGFRTACNALMVMKRASTLILVSNSVDILQRPSSSSSMRFFPRVLSSRILAPSVRRRHSGFRSSDFTGGEKKNTFSRDRRRRNCRWFAQTFLQLGPVSDSFSALSRTMEMHRDTLTKLHE